MEHPLVKFDHPLALFQFVNFYFLNDHCALLFLFYVIASEAKHLCYIKNKIFATAILLNCTNVIAKQWGAVGRRAT